jgi:Transposase
VSWAHLDRDDRQSLRALFALNRRLAKAYLLKEQLAQLWTYTYEGAARRFLANWLRALRWQRLPVFQKLGRLLTRHLEGLLNYCHEMVPFGVVEAINGNIRAMLRRGRGYRDHEYLLLRRACVRGTYLFDGPPLPGRLVRLARCTRNDRCLEVKAWPWPEQPPSSSPARSRDSRYTAPVKPIRLTRHARNRMRWHEIGEDLIRQALHVPDWKSHPWVAG